MHKLLINRKKHLPGAAFVVVLISCIALTAFVFAVTGPGCGGAGGTSGGGGGVGCASPKGAAGGSGGAPGGGNGGNGNPASNVNGGGTWGAGGGGGGGGVPAGNGGNGGIGGSLDNLGASGGSFAGNGGNGGNGGNNPTGVAGNGGNGGMGGTLLNNSSGGSSGGTGGIGGLGGSGLVGGQGGQGGKGGTMNKVGPGAGMVAGDGGAGGNGGNSTGSGAGGNGGPGGAGGDANGAFPILGGRGGTGGAGGSGCAGPGQVGSAGSMSFGAAGAGGAAGGSGGPACVPPPAPTVTPTCTANSPTATINWNSVGGFTPTSFTVDLDNDSFAGGWLYQDVSSAGPGPYSTTAPGGFNPSGPGSPSIPLAGGASYQVRINYRVSSPTGNDVYSATQPFTTRNDCAPPPPPAPSVSATCTSNQPTVDISWNAVGGLSPTSFTVDFDNDSFAGGWLYKDVSSAGPGPYSVITAPNTFSTFGASPPLIPLSPGATYQVRINYRQAFSGADVYSTTGSFTTRSDCAPVTPPPPTLTPTCTATQPTIDISWNASPGLSPSSFTTDFDNDSFAGGWLYKDTSSAGPGPYSITAAPNGFSSFGSGPGVPLNPGTTYQVRINYRAAAAGSDVQSATGTFTARNDCVPPPAITCDSINPSLVEATPTAFNLQMSYHNQPGNATLTGASVQVTVGTAPAQSSPIMAIAPDLPGDGSTRLVTIAGITTPSTGVYSVSLQFSGPNAPAAPAVCSPLKVARMPYFRVYGGDVIAGVKPTGACSGWAYDMNSGISGYASNASGKGAGTQLAALALAQISGLVSGVGRTSASGPLGYGGANGLLPKYLTLVNSGAAPANTTYGGGAGFSTCPPDYFSYNKVPSPTAPPAGGVNLNSLNGDNYFSGGLNIKASSSLPANKKLTIYVNGDVMISGDITYNTGTPWAIGSIPSVYIVAKGNIYVQPNVTQLDGVYVAQPNTTSAVTIANTGKFYSCANNLSAPDPVFINGNCQTNNLTINGAVYAQRLRLFRIVGTRDSGSINEDATSANIAEILNLSPESWLTVPAPFTVGPIDDYNAITGLQPIL